MKPQLLTTGRAALAAGLLMIAGTQGEWVLDPQRDDGTVTDVPVLAGLLLVATVGFVLLLIAVLGLFRTPVGMPRVGTRVGGGLTIAGAGLLALFGVSALTSTLLSGSPWEAAFVAFLLGMLLLALGCITWALSLRRRSPGAGVWQTLLVIGVLALAALLIEPDPWHDLCLVGMFAGWSVVGILLLRAPRISAQTRESTPRTASTL